jgi:hypothetical protein
MKRDILLSCAEKPFEQVQRLRVVANEHDLVLALFVRVPRVNLRKKPASTDALSNTERPCDERGRAPVQHQKLAAPLRVYDLRAPAAAPRATPAAAAASPTRALAHPAEVVGDQRVRAAQVLRQVEQLRVVAELLEDVDRLQRLRLLAAEERLDLGRGDEEAIELQLERRRLAEDDLLVLDGNCEARISTRFIARERGEY